MVRRLTFLSCSVFAALLFLVSARSSLLAQQPTLQDVLAKAAQYVATIADPSRILFGEERYEHTALKLMVNMSGGVERTPQGGRKFTAELAVVATPDYAKDGLPWIEARDITVLDGKPARDGVSRLGVLVNQPLAVAVPQAMEIMRASKGSQFGRFDRAVVLPRLPIVFLHEVNQPRFTFRKSGEKSFKGIKTWEVKYQEKTSPSILVATDGKSALSSGSFWIDLETGHILQSTLKNGDSSVLFDEITTTYALDQATGLWLPATLSDKGVDTDEGWEIEGKGTFKSWRFAPRTAK